MLYLTHLFESLGDFPADLVEGLSSVARSSFRRSLLHTQSQLRLNKTLMYPETKVK